MIFNDRKKFNKEIELLKSIKSPELDPGSKQRAKAFLFNRISAETNISARRYMNTERKLTMNPFARYAAIGLVGLGLVGGTVFASNSAKPGDILFPVKKVAEKVQISLSSSDTAKAQLETNIAEQRIQNINEVSVQHKAEAKVEAQSETDNALSTLKRVQGDLQAKGNTTAAAAIGENISKLQGKAKDNQLKVESDLNENTKDNENDQQDNTAAEVQDQQNDDSADSAAANVKMKTGKDGQKQDKADKSKNSDQTDSSND